MGQWGQCILFSVVFTSSLPSHLTQCLGPTSNCHLLTNTMTQVRSCLSIWWEWFRGTHRKDDRGSLSIKSSREGVIVLSNIKSKTIPAIAGPRERGGGVSTLWRYLSDPLSKTTWTNSAHWMSRKPPESSEPPKSCLENGLSHTVPKVGNKNSQKRNTARPRSQFLHACIFYIPMIGLSILLHCFCGLMVGIYKSLTDTCRM